MTQPGETTHFGFRDRAARRKSRTLVDDVFHSVAAATT